MKFIRLTRIPVAIIALLFSANSASAVNIVVNGTFDDTVSGWVGTWFIASGPSGGYPTTPSQPYYHSGANAFNEIYQIHNIGGLGNLFKMSANLFGYSSQGDYSTYIVEFFDGLAGAGSSLGLSSLTSTTVDPGTWPTAWSAGDYAANLQSITAAIPTGSLSVVVKVSGTRVAGSSSDGYADNVALDITQASIGVPDAGSTLVLLSLSLLSVCLFRKRL